MNATCKYCGKSGFKWTEVPNVGWQLKDQNGAIHLCQSEYPIEEFANRYLDGKIPDEPKDLPELQSFEEAQFDEFKGAVVSFIEDNMLLSGKCVISDHLFEILFVRHDKYFEKWRIDNNYDVQIEKNRRILTKLDN